ncbi:MAG: hypothetical protein OEV76_11615 [Anaerolineae bacterium]|jgi:hypothetical protein|nr:hypothetical protein [Anaerolineae bacterium]
MKDRNTKQLVDYTGIFFDLQRAIAEQYKIQQRLLQEGAHVATPDEGQEFARLRRAMEKEKDVKKVVRDLLLLQEATAHAVAYLLAKNNERLIALFSEKD